MSREPELVGPEKNYDGTLRALTHGELRATENGGVVCDPRRNGHAPGIENSLNGTTRDPNLISRRGNSNVSSKSGGGWFVSKRLKPAAHGAYNNTRSAIKGNNYGPVKYPVAPPSGWVGAWTTILTYARSSCRFRVSVTCHVQQTCP